MRSMARLRNKTMACLAPFLLHWEMTLQCQGPCATLGIFPASQGLTHLPTILGHVPVDLVRDKTQLEDKQPTRLMEIYSGPAVTLAETVASVFLKL